MEFLVAVFVFLMIGISAVWFGVRASKGKALPHDALNDAQVEWSVSEQTDGLGYTTWPWKVQVGNQTKSGNRMWKNDAISDARAAARRLLGQGEQLGKTRPCALCGKPSLVGQDTDTEECATLLKKARAELAELPQVNL